VTKAVLLVAVLFWPLLSFATDQPSLAELDRVLMRVPPAPLKWQTNLTSLTAEAEQGDINAELDLGLHYVFAVGTPQRLDKALYWLGKSADQNFPPAEYTLGMMCKRGVGVVSNQATADAILGTLASPNPATRGVASGHVLESGDGIRYHLRHGSMHSTSIWPSLSERRCGLSCMPWPLPRLQQLQRLHVVLALVLQLSVG